MRAIIQRVNSSKLYIEGEIYSQIKKGYLVLLAVSEDDEKRDLDYIVKKTLGLRIFEDENEKMNLSIKDVEGEIMIVSQFTLYGDVRKGNRPNFMKSAKHEKAELMYNEFIELIKNEIEIVETGKFGANMDIELINNGPVTIQLDSSKIY
ncbi:D-aminoacyl-tRNA deacylase [Helcococcus kunzii]|uniref:D-aminoacyl-tRNA deacylase n=1 Tax=Helcococcus kunzii TaxID=40091 RepID=UPI001BAE6DBD|nr:D-aminoacyl-tRNA deacylase [Helcococcus kunzii]MCT1795491.1 D-aminoacyl-tRNA deacylase [Helcococcus kunzii]MCT1989171.1 D-aminoacyl-tRNA deacylase [Helcococcus kunzii]QUY64737.1 D-tyrosyl-tRNA(Tyr) deacylase [Helcococcus kunzii]